MYDIKSLAVLAVLLIRAGEIEQLLLSLCEGLKQLYNICMGVAPAARVKFYYVIGTCS